MLIQMTLQRKSMEYGLGIANQWVSARKKVRKKARSLKMLELSSSSTLSKFEVGAESMCMCNTEKNFGQANVKPLYTHTALPKSPVACNLADHLSTSFQEEPTNERNTT